MTQKDKLRERKIYNNHNIAKLGDGYFVAYSSNGGRSMLPSWWAVYHIGYKFKSSAWYEGGARTFSGKKSDKETLLRALIFASKASGQYEWVKTPFGGYVSRYTMDKVGIKYKEDQVIKINKDGKL